MLLTWDREIFFGNPLEDEIVVVDLEEDDFDVIYDPDEDEDEEGFDDDEDGFFIDYDTQDPYDDGYGDDDDFLDGNSADDDGDDPTVYYNKYKIILKIRFIHGAQNG